MLLKLFVQTTINPSVGCTAKGFVQKDKHLKKTCGEIKQSLKKAIISVFHTYLEDKNSALPLPNLPPLAPRFALLSPASSWAAKSIPSHCNIMLWLGTLRPLCITNWDKMAELSKWPHSGQLNIWRMKTNCLSKEAALKTSRFSSAEPA